MMYHLILCGLFIKIAIYANSLGTFIATFQSSGKWSPDEYLEYTDNIPILKEFTACHWERTKTISEKINSVWAYCQHFSANDWYLRCIQFFSHYPNPDGKLIMELYNNGWINDTMFFEMKFEPSPYLHQRWNHFCVVYSSIKGTSWLYHNGELISTLSLNDKSIKGTTILPTIPSSNKSYISSFIVGQEPDSMKGNFSEDQAFTGEISELNIWDTILTSSKINAISSCLQWPKGNIVNWNTRKWVKNKVEIKENVNKSEYCKKETSYLYIPGKLTLTDAEKKCKIYGGKISLPKTTNENTKMANMLLRKDEPNGTKTNELSGAWLGLENRNGIWHDLESLETSDGSIDYSNWRKFYSTTRHRLDYLCPYMDIDGTWAYGINSVCEYLTKSAICSIAKTPTFLLKGDDSKFAMIDRLYYMSFDNRNNLKGFSGIAKKSSISIDDGKAWSLQINSRGSEKLVLNQSKQPVGRNDWYYLNVKDEKSQNLCLSNCKFGEEFTCDSGECIAMKKRCDRTYDCQDGSDEALCLRVTIPRAYARNSAPSILEGEIRVTKLTTKCIVEKVDFIDTINTKIGLILTLQMFWTDSRLMYKNLHRREKSKIPSHMSEKIWLPLDNSIHAYAILGKILSDGEQLVEIYGKNKLPMSLQNSREDYYYSGSNNTVSMIQRFQVEYDCHFDLQKYPFDEQLCRFGLDIKGKDDEIFLLIHNASDSIAYIGSKDVGDFEIMEVTDNATTCKKDLKQDNNFSSTPEFLLCIRVKRSHADQIVSIFCPSILFWLLAYCTLFLDIRDVANRSRTSVTLLLVYVALLQTVKKDFPKTTYYKFIDIWFLWYVFNTFIISLYHIILPKIIKNRGEMEMESIKSDIDSKKQAWTKEEEANGTTRKMRKIDLILIISLPIFMILFNVAYFTFTQ